MSTKKQSKQPTKKQLIEKVIEQDKGIECVKGFIEQVEGQMKALSPDGTIPTEGETCLGCRLVGYAEHNKAIILSTFGVNDKLEEEIKDLKKENEKLTERSPLIKKLKEDNQKLKKEVSNLTDRLFFSEEQNNPLLKIIDELKEYIEELKHQKNQLEDFFVPSAPEAFALNKENEKLKEEIEKFKKEIDTMFDVTEYPVDMIEDGYTKLDAIYEWVPNRDGEIEKLKEDIDSRSERSQEDVLRMCRLSGLGYDIEKDRGVNLNLMEKEIKSQIPDKKGKKLSQNDKQLLAEVFTGILPHEPPPPIIKLFERLMK